VVRLYVVINACAVPGPDWRTVRSYLPADLDRLACETGALERSRGVKTGESLLRMILLWALPGGSFDRAAGEALRLGLAKLSGPAFFKRVVNSEAFLESSFKYLLKHGGGRIPLWKGFKVVAVDATVLCGPGASGTDQRLHTAYELSSGRALKVEVTDVKGGETFRRFLDFGAGHLILADQGYGRGPGIVPLLMSGASVLVRFNFHSIRLLDACGVKISPEDAQSLLPDDGMIELKVSLPGWDKSLRAFGARNPEGKGVWLLSDLGADQLQMHEVRDLYGMRWQIELFFKRLKSILDVDEIPTREGPSARQWIWAKLILATLAALIRPEPFPPYKDPDDRNTGLPAHPAPRKRGRPRKTENPQEAKIKAQAQPLGPTR